jgi:DNA-binding response OmpR family regulator
MKVLVVEEHPIVARAMSQQFKVFGCLVTTEADARAAFARAMIDDFDLVVCDWQMSHMPSSAFVRGVRDGAEAMPDILVVSASDSDESEAEARASGADAFLDKPLHRDDVGRLLRDCVSRQLGEDVTSSRRVLPYRQDAMFLDGGTHD